MKFEICNFCKHVVDERDENAPWVQVPTTTGPAAEAPKVHAACYENQLERQAKQVEAEKARTEAKRGMASEKRRSARAAKAKAAKAKPQAAKQPERRQEEQPEKAAAAAA